MSIEQLTSTIIESAQQKAKEVTDKYEQEIQRINAAVQEDIKKLTQENNEYISTQKTLIQTRITSSAQLKAQQQILETKWQIINDIFSKAKQTFLASEKYTNFFMDTLTQNNDNDSELFIASRDIDKIQKMFPNLKYTITDDLSGGIIIRKGRIELNFSIDKIFDSLKNELIIDLSKLLFE